MKEVINMDFLDYYKDKDSMVTMITKWKIYQREGSILLENMKTGEAQFIDLDEETIELESNGRIRRGKINVRVKRLSK
jgi:hypothetical protein